MTYTPRITADGKGAKVTLPAPVTVAGKEYAAGVHKFETASAAMEFNNAAQDAYDQAAREEETKGGLKLTTSKGKFTVTGSGLGYKGQIFSGFIADFEALADWLGSPADSPGRKAFNAKKDQILATWQTYSELPVGAALPDGSTKPALKR